MANPTAKQKLALAKQGSGLPANHPTGRAPSKSAPAPQAPSKEAPNEDMLPGGLVGAVQSKQWRTHDVSTKAPDHRVAQAHTEPKAGSHARVPTPSN